MRGMIILLAFLCTATAVGPARAANPYAAAYTVNNGVITYETRVMEKVKGDWRIAMVELIFNANEKITQDSGGN